MQRQRPGKRSTKALGRLLRCGGATKHTGEPPQPASKTCSWSVATTAPARGKITEKLSPEQGALGQEASCQWILLLHTARQDLTRGSAGCAVTFPQGVSISSRQRGSGKIGTTHMSALSHTSSRLRRACHPTHRGLSASRSCHTPNLAIFYRYTD